MVNILISIMIIFIVLVIVFLIASVIYLKTGLFKIFYHDILEWHLPNNSPQSYDGCSIHSTCKYCGKEIMQDSQGNWF